MAEEKKKSFMEHFLELRARVLFCVLFLLAATAVALVFGRDVLDFIMLPFNEAALVIGKSDAFRITSIRPVESFNVYLVASLIAGLVLASPFLVYQIWCFVDPGLLEKERKALKPLLWLGAVLFALGALFGHLYVTKLAFLYLMKFNDWIGVHPQWTISAVVNFCGVIFIAFGTAFELPIVILFLTKIGLMTPGKLRRGRRYFVVIACIISALLTPPDPVSMIAMAVPLVLLYEIGIILSKGVYRGEPEEGDAAKNKNV